MSRDKFANAYEGETNPPNADTTFTSAPKPGDMPRRRTELPKNALVPVQGGYQVYGCLITSTGINFPEKFTEEQWETIGGYLLEVESALTWALADWLIYGEDHKWGETYARVAAEYDLKVDTLYHYALVARKIWIRNPDLSFAHHRLVAGKSPDEQQYWLDRAVEERYSIQQLREAMRGKPPTPPSNSLANIENKQAIDRVWRAIRRGKGGISREDIHHIRRWLDEVESRLE